MKRTSLLKALLTTLLLVLPAAVHAYDISKTANSVTTYYNIVYNEDGSYRNWTSSIYRCMELTYKTDSYNSYSGTIYIVTSQSHNLVQYYTIGIGDRACYNCTNLTTVKYNEESAGAGNSLYIGEAAFANCTSLSSIPLVKTCVASIGDSAFYNCPLLTEDGLSLPNTLETIGNHTFENCTGLTTLDLSYTKLTSIGDYAFAGCTGLTSITLPSTVTSIGAHAFDGCIALKTVEGLEDTQITRIEDYTFNECTSIGYYGSYIYLPSTLEYIGNYAFYDCGMIWKLTIPENVKTIGDYAFYYCKDIYPLTMNSTVLETIGEHAFQLCTSIMSVALPSTVKSIGTYAFSGCNSLQSVGDLGNTAITEIPDYAFRSCDFRTITIPENIKSIGEYAFGGSSYLSHVNWNATNCTSCADNVFSGCGQVAWPLVSSGSINLTIGENVESFPENLIGSYGSGVLISELYFNAKNCADFSSAPFYYPNYFTGVSIGENVTRIPAYLFYGPSSSRALPVTSITIPSKVTEIGDYAIYNCTKLASLTIESSVLKSIGNYAFDNCTALTSVTLPSSLTSLGKYAFYNCSKLTLSGLGETSITSIPDYVFYGCSKLASIDIPSTVTSLGTYAFYNCSSLATITVQSSTAATCGTDAFSNIASNSWLVVPEDAAANYGGIAGATVATQTGWSSIAHMREVSATVPMTTDEGYATYYSPYSYTLDENLEGGIISGADSDGNLTIEWKYGSGDGESPVVPAGTAILVKGPQNAKSEDSEDHLIVNTTINTDDTTYPQPETNMLFGTVDTSYGYTDVPTDEDNSGNYYYYKLTHYTDPDTEKTSLGFYWGAEGGVAFNVGSGGAKKAWLALPKDLIDGTSDEAKISFYPLEGDGASEEVENGIDSSIENGADSDETATGISSLSADSGDAIIYNLAGQRVNDMNKRGVYIVNGRKVVKK